MELPDGWRGAVDTAGRRYYYHKVSKETSWKRPTATGPSANTRVTRAEEEKPLWRSAVDERGRQYFYNRSTRVAQWQAPTGVRVPPLALADGERALSDGAAQRPAEAHTSGGEGGKDSTAGGLQEHIDRARALLALLSPAESGPPLTAGAGDGYRLPAPAVFGGAAVPSVRPLSPLAAVAASLQVEEGPEVIGYASTPPLYRAAGGWDGRARPRTAGGGTPASPQGALVLGILRARSPLVAYGRVSASMYRSEVGEGAEGDGSVAAIPSLSSLSPPPQVDASHAPRFSGPHRARYARACTSSPDGVKLLLSQHAERAVQRQGAGTGATAVQVEGVIPLSVPGAALSPSSLPLQLCGLLAVRFVGGGGSGRMGGGDTSGQHAWATRFLLTHRWHLLVYPDDTTPATAPSAALDLRFTTDAFVTRDASSPSRPFLSLFGAGWGILEVRGESGEETGMWHASLLRIMRQYGCEAQGGTRLASDLLVGDGGGGGTWAPSERPDTLASPTPIASPSAAFRLQKDRPPHVAVAPTKGEEAHPLTGVGEGGAAVELRRPDGKRRSVLASPPSTSPSPAAAVPAPPSLEAHHGVTLRMSGGRVRFSLPASALSSVLPLPSPPPQAAGDTSSTSTPALFSPQTGGDGVGSAPLVRAGEEAEGVAELEAQAVERALAALQRALPPPPPPPPKRGSRTGKGGSSQPSRANSVQAGGGGGVEGGEGGAKPKVSDEGAHPHGLPAPSLLPPPPPLLTSTPPAVPRFGRLRATVAWLTSRGGRGSTTTRDDGVRPTPLPAPPPVMLPSPRAEEAHGSPPRSKSSGDRRTAPPPHSTGADTHVGGTGGNPGGLWRRGAQELGMVGALHAVEAQAGGTGAHAVPAAPLTPPPSHHPTGERGVARPHPLPLDHPTSSSPGILASIEGILASTPLLARHSTEPLARRGDAGPAAPPSAGKRGVHDPLPPPPWAVPLPVLALRGGGGARSPPPQLSVVVEEGEGRKALGKRPSHPLQALSPPPTQHGFPAVHLSDSDEESLEGHVDAVSARLTRLAGLMEGVEWWGERAEATPPAPPSRRDPLPDPPHRSARPRNLLAEAVQSGPFSPYARMRGARR